MSNSTPKCFLSYAREDREIVEKLYIELSEAGLKPWMDTNDIHPGEDWERALWRGIREADFFIFCLSQHSVEKRGYLQKELKLALELWKEKLEDDIYLIPARLEECPVPDAIKRWEYVDLFRKGGMSRLQETFKVGLERLRVGDLGDNLSEKVVIRDLTEKNETLDYEFQASFPEFSHKGATWAPEINTLIKAFVVEKLHYLRRGSIDLNYASKLAPKDAEPLLTDEISLAHRIETWTSSLLSIRFTTSVYFGGAAHPNSWTSTFNFQLNPPVGLNLSDLFSNEPVYLDTLSGYCIDDLRKQQRDYSHDLDGVRIDEWLAAGAGPEETNYSKFLTCPEGIKIVFDPYQVGSYAEGRYEVMVPYGHIRQILSERFKTLIA